MRSLYTEWRNFNNRHQKNDLSKRQSQKGPLTLEARLKGLEDVLAIQQEINQSAQKLGVPKIDLINQEEETRIRELIAAGTYPQGWSGTEPLGSELLAEVFGDYVQMPLFSFGKK